MKFGISNIGWDFNKSELMFKSLSELNILNIEIAPTKICEWDDPKIFEKLEEYKKLANSYGINICGLQSIYFKKQFNVFKDDEFVNHFKLVIDICQELEAEYIVYGSPKTRIISENDNLSRFTDVFSNLADVSKNINICIEPNPITYGGNFITNMEEGIEVVRKINKENIKLHIDTSELIINEENIMDFDTKLCRTSHISNPGLSKISENYSDIYSDIFNLDLDYITLESTDCNSVESLIKQIECLKINKIYG